MLHKIKYFIAGLILWLRMGIPFKDAMEAAREAEEITRKHGL